MSSIFKKSEEFQVAEKRLRSAFQSIQDDAEASIERNVKDMKEIIRKGLEKDLGDEWKELTEEKKEACVMYGLATVFNPVVDRKNKKMKEVQDAYDSGDEEKGNQEFVKLISGDW